MTLTKTDQFGTYVNDDGIRLHLLKPMDRAAISNALACCGNCEDAVQRLIARLEIAWNVISDVLDHSTPVNDATEQHRLFEVPS